MSAKLSDYLQRVGTGYRIGARDCCTFMADWLLELGLPDVMADRRGSYASARDFRRMLMSEGGLVAACHRRFSAAGLVVTSRPRAGDVAAIMLPYARRGGATCWRATGAIALSEAHFAALTLRGILIAGTMPAAKIWRAPHA